jgi:uncharacterized membrane protein
VAGSQSKGKSRAKGSARSKAKSRKPRGSGRSAAKQNAGPRPSEYAKEAASEWRKAARLAAAALSPGAKNAIRRLKSANSTRGGQVGSAADALLAKMGRPGKLAARMSLGTRAVEKLRPGGAGGAKPGADVDPEGVAGSSGNGAAGNLPVPIQESIEIAVPVKVAYMLATRFDEYPRFVEHVEAVEEDRADVVAFEVKLRGSHRTVGIELVDQQPGQRLEWRGIEGPDHVGVLSFHELAPRLTHLELSVELEPEGMVQRLTRTAHLTERAIRMELQRFKAYAELWQDEVEIRGADEPAETGEADAETADTDDGDEGESVAERKPEGSGDEGTADEYEDDEEYEEDEQYDEGDEEPVEAYEDDFEDEEDEEEEYEDEAYEDERPVEAYSDVEPAPAR